MIVDIINQPSNLAMFDTWFGRRSGRPQVERLRFPLQRRELQVLRTEQPSPGFQRITLGGDSLRDFQSASFDDHVKLLLDDGRGGLIKRDYTPRRFDPARAELVIDFALHAHGPASDWARHARPGDRVSVGGPRGSLVVSPDFDGHWLVGDASAWPAICRRLESLPAGAQVSVIALLPDAADRLLPDCSCAPQLHWAADDAAVLAALRALPAVSGHSHVWCAGEAGLMAGVRDVLRQRGVDARQPNKVAAYWKRGVADFHDAH